LFTHITFTYILRRLYVFIHIYKKFYIPKTIESINIQDKTNFKYLDVLNYLVRKFS